MIKMRIRLLIFLFTVIVVSPKFNDLISSNLTESLIRAVRHTPTKTEKDFNPKRDVEEFINNALETIYTRNSSMISDLFHSNFYYLSCDIKYSKDKAVNYLVSQKENTKYTFYFKKLRLSENRIIFTSLVFGFGNGKNTMVLELDPEAEQLNYGYNEQCKDFWPDDA
ncbi:unnamed protein product [Caenorhabditis nigoni]